MGMFEEEPIETAELSGTLVLDADTVAYSVCSASEVVQELLPKEFYTAVEWLELINDPRYVKKTHCIYDIDIADATATAIEYVRGIQEATLTKEVECYCSTGKNFRFTVDPTYKMNRADTRYPNGLLEVKKALVDHFGGELCTTYEADDIVVYRKRTDPDIIMSSVDKDVLNSVPGKHYNYYRSNKYNIKPKWVEITKEHAEKFSYLQCLMGDQADGIMGVPGIGPKKAEKALIDCTTHEEMWSVVVDLYLAKGLTVKDAIRTMRLVHMGQVFPNKEGKLVWEPWTPPIGV